MTVGKMHFVAVVATPSALLTRSLSAPNRYLPSVSKFAKADDSYKPILLSGDQQRLPTTYGTV